MNLTEVQAQQPPIDRDEVDAVIATYPQNGSALIQVLQDLNRRYHYLPCHALLRVAERLSVPIAKVFSVATFYKAFSLTPRGRVLVRVCVGTACHIRGAQLLAEEVARRLGVAAGETTPDLGFTFETVNCVGACAMAPVVIRGERHYGSVAPGDVPTIIEGTTHD